MKPELRSWMTTIAGIGAVLSALGAIMVAGFDNNPDTVVNVDALFKALAALSAIFTGGGLVAARDSRRSTEDVVFGRPRKRTPGR